MSFVKKIVSLAALAYLSQSALAAQVSESHIIAIGSNSSTQANLKSLKFAEADAQRFSRAMEVVGLVPAKNITVLESPRLADVRLAFQTIRQQVQAKNMNAGKFIFYFSGHSDINGIHLRDGVLTKDELHRSLTNIDSSTKVSIIDGCFAGSLSSKGVTKAPAFELPKFEYDEPTGSVFLSATSAQDYAYESEEMQGSVFTHYIVNGLYGEADGNKDGVVTVDELYQFVYRNTKMASLSLPITNIQRPEFLSNLKGRGAVALAFPISGAGQLKLSEEMKGTVSIVSEKGMQLFKITKNEGEARVLQIPTGTYQVAVQQTKQVGRGIATIQSAKIVALNSSNLQWSDVSRLPQSVKKGSRRDKMDYEFMAGLRDTLLKNKYLTSHFTADVGANFGSENLEDDFRWLVKLGFTGNVFSPTKLNDSLALDYREYRLSGGLQFENPLEDDPYSPNLILAGDIGVRRVSQNILYRSSEHAFRVAKQTMPFLGGSVGLRWCAYCDYSFGVKTTFDGSVMNAVSASGSSLEPAFFYSFGMFFYY